MNDKEFTWNASAQGMFLSLSRKMLLCLWFNGQETFSFTLSCISVEYCHFYLVFWVFTGCVISHSQVQGVPLY